MRQALITGLSVLAGGLILLAIQYLTASPDRTRYVSMTQVFEASKLHTQYAVELESIQKQSNAQLARMQAKVAQYGRLHPGAPETITMEKQLMESRDAMSAEYSRKSEAFQAIIWKEINAKITRYGETHGLDFILGAKGDGTIMFAHPDKDITPAIIAYINR